MFWPDDGINAGNHCAFPIVSRQWIDALGYFTPECFLFFYHDTWIYDIAKKINTEVYIPEIEIEHLHFTANKSNYDRTYQMHRMTNKNAIDKDMFIKTDKARDSAAKEIRRRIESYILLNNKSV
jgi:hypothetical protein